MQEEKTLKVSVCVVTYNQKKYIRQCLQSIVDQETDFDFEVIVGDDCSTDGTRAIVQEFAEQYPGMVKPIFHEKNIGAYKNFPFVHQQAIGEYIAHMDGDDYALPGKLQVQTDFLDHHPEFNIVWHAMKVVNETSGRIRGNYLPRGLHPNGWIDRGDLLAIGSVGTHSSLMYRGKYRKYLKSNFDFIDFYAAVQLIGDGKGMHINEVLGVYRENQGIATQNNKTRQVLLNNLSALLHQYPDYKSRIGTQAFRLFVGDFIRMGPTLNMSWNLVRNTFTAKILFDSIRIYGLIKYGKRTMGKEALGANPPVPSPMPIDREEWGKQLNLSNFVNTYYQYRDLQLFKACGRVLIIGPGQGLDAIILKWRGYEVRTFDIDETFSPDFTGSVHDLSFFSDREFDVVIVSHVLEHLPELYLDVALKEISRVGKYALVYLPVHGKHVQFKVSLGSREYSLIVDLFNFFKKTDGVTARYMGGQHYWEIGVRGYRVRDLTNRLSKHFKIIDSYRNKDWMPSYNFVLESK